MTPRVRLPRRAAVLALRLGAALLSGLALWLSFPAHDAYLLAPVGVALLCAALWGARPGAGFLLGLVGGLALFVPVLSWSGIFVGRLPWYALAALEATYIALMAAGTSWLQGRLLRRGWAALAVAVVPVLWVVQESARSTTPFGGFPWARLAFSQADSPLARLASLGGAPAVTFAVAAAGAALFALGRTAYAVARRGTPLTPTRRTVVPAVVGAAVLAGLPLAAGAVPLATDGRQVPVAMVQGNVPRAGLDFNAERRAVLDNHAAGTGRVGEAVAAGRAQQPALVIWPENSSDIDPFRNPDAGQVIRDAVAAVDVPVLVGAVLAEPSPRISNAALLYRPGATGAPERYVKQHPVPFAEYIPFRSFFRVFSDKVDLVRADFAAGDEVGTFRVDAPGGAFWASPTICFEVAYDGLVRESVAAPEGPGLLVVQTNNATFGYTAESEQQFAISRIRAIEHGRSVAHVSTVGVSGFIAPDGSVTGKTGLFTAEQVIGSPVVRSGVTLSDRIGQLPEALCLAVAAVLVALVLRPHRDARVVPMSSAPHQKEPLGV